MKKILTSTAVVAAVAALSGALVACGDTNSGKGKTDQQIADEAISVIRTLYADKAESTPVDYTVNGLQPVDGKTYAINWTVSSDFANIEQYVTVGEINDKKQVPITIKKATEEIEYTLKATVNVGKASASEEFKRKVPAGLEQGEDEETKSIDFSSTATRDSYSATQQIWKQNGITVTNDKGASGTNVDNAWANVGDNKHIRFYKDSTVTIEYPGMTKLLFYSTAPYTSGDKVTDYPAYLKSSLEAAGLGTVTANTETNTVTLELSVPMDSITFNASAGQVRLTTLDVVANTNGTTDQNKVDGAKILLNLTKTNFTLTGTYDLPVKQGAADVAWTVATNAYAVIENNKLKINALPETEAELTLTAELSLNGATATKEFKVKVSNIGVENDGSEEHPYTATEAWKIANMGSTEEVYVTGYVALPGTYSGATYNNFDNMYITDSYDAATEYSYTDYTKGEDIGLFLIYRPRAEGGFLTAEGLNAGDLVTFKGNLANHNNKSPQLTNGVCVARTEPERTDVEDALRAVASTLTVTATGETALAASTVDSVTFTWSTEDTTYTVTGNTADGFKLNVAALPATPATVTLTVSATDGTETKTKTVTVTVKVPTNYGTETAPLSVTAALEITKDECKNPDAVTEQVVWMTGKLTNTPTEKTNSSTGVVYYQTLYLADPADSTKSILVYSVNLREDGVVPMQNDTLVISGYIKNYSGTIEFTSVNGTNVYIESDTRGTSTLTLDIQKDAEENATATVTGIPETATLNGMEVTFTVTPNEGKQITAVKVGGKKIEPTETNGTTYKFTVAGDATVAVETSDVGTVVPSEVELSFANTANRIKLDPDTDKTQVWEQNGIKFTNDQASSTSKIADTSAPVRLYASSSIKVECTNMVEIVFVCNNATYAADLQTSIGTVEGATVTVEGSNVTVKFATACNEFNVAKLTKQVRLDSITVKAQPSTPAEG